MTDLLGPASAANSVTSRPGESRTFGGLDTWFKDCSSPTAQDGTAIVASFLNGLLAQLRNVIRGRNITIDDTDDNMLLKAIQNGSAPYAVDTGAVNALVVDVNTPGFQIGSGTSIKVKVANTVTGPATIDVKNGGVDIATYNITRRDASALNPYDLVAGQVVALVNDGTEFQIPYNIDGGTGDVTLTLKTAADPGKVMMNDGTLGSAASGATIRANADCLQLYSRVWSGVSNSFAPVTGGRGGSAAADFAANKPIQLLAALGRAIALSGAGSGLTSRSLGQNLGEETHALITAELAVHNHGVTDPTHAHSYTQPTFPGSNGSAGSASAGSTGATTGASATGISIQNAGSGTAHNNMQPTVCMNAMIRL